MTRRRLLGCAILACWLGVVAWHVRREYFEPRAVRLAEGAQLIAPGRYFYRVGMDGRTLGFATTRVDTARDTFVVSERMVLDVPAMDTLHRATVRTRVVLDGSLGLRSFSFRLRSEIGRFRVRGEARGDSLLALEVSAGGDEREHTIAMPEDWTLAAVLPLRLAAAGQLEVGRRVSARLFDPSTLATREVVVRVTARDTMIVPDSAALGPEGERWLAARWDTIPVWRIEQRFAGITLSSWVDADGRVVRAESPIGVRIERTAFQIARAAWQRARKRSLEGGYGPVIESTAIASDVRLDDIAARERLAVRLGGVELEGFDLSGGRQTLVGDTLVITREDVSALDPAWRLPYEGDAVPPRTLAPTPLIQSDAPRIRRLAHRIAGGAEGPVAAARRLTRWVHDELAKRITLSVPSALQVLEARAGDCNEHTVLYVALARALGLPARTAVGLVYVRGQFYYHAWPEVWLGRWVAVDPTLGQFPADAAHLRFLTGGLARQVELVRLIGRLELEVL